MVLDYWAHYVVESNDVADVNEHGAELGLRDWLTLIRKKSAETADHYQEGVDECGGAVEWLSSWDDEQCARMADRPANVQFDPTALVAALDDVREQGRRRGHRAALDAIMERREEWFGELDDGLQELLDDEEPDVGYDYHPRGYEGVVEESKAADVEQRRGMDDTIREGCVAFGLAVPEALTA